VKRRAGAKTVLSRTRKSSFTRAEITRVVFALWPTIVEPFRRHSVVTITGTNPRSRFRALVWLISNPTVHSKAKDEKEFLAEAEAKFADHKCEKYPLPPKFRLIGK